MADDSTTDAQLLERLRRGDLTALEALYARHGTALLRLAFRLTGSREDAEEVVQDVFVGLPTTLRRYRETGAFAPWIRRVTARLALTALRRARARREEALPAGPNESDQSLATTDKHPAERIVTRLTLEEAIAALPDALRAVFVLREIGDLSHAEVASLLGIRRGTSEVRLHRAIQLLRIHLHGDR